MPSGVHPAYRSRIDWVCSAPHTKPGFRDAVHSAHNFVSLLLTGRSSQCVHTARFSRLHVGHSRAFGPG